MIKNIHQEEGMTVVELSGRFDAPTAPNVKAQLVELIAGGQHRLVFNLRDIDFIDSAGLGVLVSCLRRCVANGGDLCLAEVPEFARSIFELTRLTRVFRIEDSVAEALQTMRSGEQQ